MLVKTLKSIVFPKRNEEFDDSVLLTKHFNKHADSVLARASKFEDPVRMKEFHQFCLLINEIASFADQHDYKNIPANGFRSFIKIWTRLMEAAASLPTDEEVKKFMKTLEVAKIMADDLKKFHNSDPIKDYDLDTARENLAKFLGIFVEHHEVWSVLNQPAFAFIQLGRSLKVVGQMYKKLMVMGMPDVSYSTAFNCLYDEQLTTNTVGNFLAQGFNLRYVTKFIRTGDSFNWIAENLLSAFRVVTGIEESTPSQSFNPQVESPFRLNVSAHGVTLVENDNSEKHTLHVRVIKSNVKPSPDDILNGYPNQNHNNQYHKKLLIYLHGGAFCGPRAPACELLYVKKWSSSMPGLTIVNFDYSLGPEERFPTAVQELLDFYLWLRCYRNHPEEVIEVLGFVPEEIVFAGESAGGNMTTSVVVALNEIKNNFDATIKMPKGLILMYSKLCMNYQFFPSMLNTMHDIMIPPHIFPICAQAYIPFTVKDNKTNSWRLMSKEEQNKLDRNDVSGPDIKWLDSPFISPLHYDKFHQMTETSLHILSFDYDPFLDESILLAKQWPGRVQMKILDDTCHGAILLRGISLEGFAANVEAEHLIKCSLLY